MSSAPKQSPSQIPKMELVRVITLKLFGYDPVSGDFNFPLPKNIFAALKCYRIFQISVEMGT